MKIRRLFENRFSLLDDYSNTVLSLTLVYSNVASVGQSIVDYNRNSSPGNHNEGDYSRSLSC